MNHFSQSIDVFRDRVTPEQDCQSVGYLALILKYDLKVLLPETLSVISSKHKKYSKNGWSVYTPRYMPKNSIVGHLTFALKYEGVDLAVLNALFQKVDEKQMAEILQESLTDRYHRRIWFFYEWLTGKVLEIPDVAVAHSVDVLDPDSYYVGPSILSKRHRVKNNLPGVKNFCPLVRKTAKLEKYVSQNLKDLAHEKTKAIHPDVLARAAAFLLLKDSQASFAIEGERPEKNRAERWGKAICKAGQHSLSQVELERLQNIVIEDTRFVKMGFRKEGGFIGTRERLANTPIPDHISAKWEDVAALINGLIETEERLRKSEIDPIIAATIIAFGFVFIHPFEDGNGRIHRYLIHHVLNERKFSPDGIIFPVSAAILNSTREYKNVLESYSKSRLELVEWCATENGNVEVLNETMDLYRYFDATKQAEFLYDCVHQTIAEILPEEVFFLEKYDRMKSAINERFDMSDRVTDLLIRFLEQNRGNLSGRAREKEFKELSEKEILELENLYKDIFGVVTS
jgi:Fic family protein